MPKIQIATSTPKSLILKSGVGSKNVYFWQVPRWFPWKFPIISPKQWYRISRVLALYSPGQLGINEVDNRHMHVCVCVRLCSLSGQMQNTVIKLVYPLLPRENIIPLFLLSILYNMDLTILPLTSSFYFPDSCYLS